MDRPNLYNDDIVTWAEEQAAAVRALAARPDLSNALDWENVAEEIESVGRSQIDAVENTLVQMLVHVLKYVSAPSAQSSQSWRTEVLVFQAAFRRRYKSAMRQRIDWDGLWMSSIKLAEGALKMFGDQIVVGLPDAFPFTPDELAASDFDMDRALERLTTILNQPDDRTQAKAN